MYVCMYICMYVCKYIRRLDIDAGYCYNTKTKHKEVRTVAEQKTQPPTLDDVMGELKDIKNELKKEARRDIQAAWLAFAVVGAGFVGTSAKDLQIPWPGNWQAIVIVSLGVIMAALGYCGVRFGWGTRRR